MNRSALLRLVSLVAVGVVGTFAACSTLQTAKSPELRAAACTAQALLPLAGTAERAQEQARALREGRVDVGGIVDAAQASHEEAEALRKALEACAAEYDKAKGGGAGASSADAE